MVRIAKQNGTRDRRDIYRDMSLDNQWGQAGQKNPLKGVFVPSPMSRQFPLSGGHGDMSW